MVVLATILANAPPPPAAKASSSSSGKLPLSSSSTLPLFGGGKLPLSSSGGGSSGCKLTVVVVPNSIAGQWMDEFKTHAPALTTVMAYGPHRDRAVAAAAGGRADVLITTPHSVERRRLTQCPRTLCTHSPRVSSAPFETGNSCLYSVCAAGQITSAGSQGVSS